MRKVIAEEDLSNFTSEKIKVTKIDSSLKLLILRNIMIKNFLVAKLNPAKIYSRVYVHANDINRCILIILACRWVCQQYSPCGNVAPLTLFGLPEYTFLFRFSNL